VRVLDLFSGIGGFSLGLERAGMRTVAFCEIEPYCRAVLRKHWPDVPCFEDVRHLHAFDVGPVDVICGGFPCQDISFAGRGAGLDGARSGLWWEYHRLIDELRPAWVIAENVSALRSRGLDQVLGSLAALGYDAEWHCIPASAVGAPHQRDRIWIAAHAHGQGQYDGPVDAEVGCASEPVADAYKPRLQGWLREILRQCAAERTARESGASIPDAPCELPHWSRTGSEQTGSPEPSDGGWWRSEPDVGRVANGVPSRVDRLRALGNAVVPQIPEIIGRAIMKVAA
jgi:DNA (cytosine-5)-methyltransferase 1